MKASLLSFAAVVLVSGCASSGVIGELPVVSNSAQAAKVIVVRVSSFVGAANTYKVGMDGKDIFGIGSGQHFMFPVESGEHYLAVRCFGGWAPTWKEDAVRFAAAPGANEYFKVTPSGSCAEIVSIPESEANALLGKSKSISSK